MDSRDEWPFEGCAVVGMYLPTYLDWATGARAFPKKLLLPPIQRGFVWKPVQIAQLWDSLLRGMPIGSLMLSKLATGDKAAGLSSSDRKIENVDIPAIGLLDGQQRTLSMLLGWESAPKGNHCVWIDLGEEGKNGSPFELRISTRTQPFGYQRHSHVKLERRDKRTARESFDKATDKKYREESDFELWDKIQAENLRPWKSGSSNALCFPLSSLWVAYRNDEMLGLKQSTSAQNPDKEKLLNLNFGKLVEAFKRMSTLEVPLVLVPEHISQPPQPEQENVHADAQAPLTLLFERIGRNGASLSPEDLLFSMIKQQWPEAHDLVAKLHDGKIGHLMSATDCVMTAYRLAMAETTEPKQSDDPRPSPNSFHRNLDKLIGEGGALRRYLNEKSDLERAFDALYSTLSYRGGDDMGLPDLMLPHLPRGLVQVLLRWFIQNLNRKVSENERTNIIAFTLFWYLCVWHEDKASKTAFGEMKAGAFPASALYKLLIEGTQEDEIKLATPLIAPERLDVILIRDDFLMFRNSETMFKKDNDKVIASYPERELFKRFCWWRKPVLLWLQRKYVHRAYPNTTEFAGLTDEDAVPYDYDHLCPQNHWGSDWRNITKSGLIKEIEDGFYRNRHDVGNCIGNLHVLDSSLNRSFGDDSLGKKITEAEHRKERKPAEDGLTEAEHKKEWKPAEDSLIVLDDLWLQASPADEAKKHCWNVERLAAFQNAVQRRTLELYRQYYEVCQVLTNVA